MILPVAAPVDVSEVFSSRIGVTVEIAADADRAVSTRPRMTDDEASPVATSRSVGVFPGVAELTALAAERSRLTTLPSTADVPFDADRAVFVYAAIVVDAPLDSDDSVFATLVDGVAVGVAVAPDTRLANAYGVTVDVDTPTSM